MAAEGLDVLEYRQSVATAEKFFKWGSTHLWVFINK
jgi:hypothetical protein